MSQNVTRPLVVFSDDWGRHPSSCQHLIKHLIPHREVVWINTIGTRPPRLDWGTAKRAAGKIREWVSPARTPTAGSHTSEPKAVGTAAANPRVFAPKMWPSFRSRFARTLNRRLLTRALRPVFEALAMPPNVVTTLPLVADLVRELPAHRWIYYCVDDFSVWPGYDGETMQCMERDLVPQMHQIVAVSETLVQHIGTFQREAHLLTHGVDLDFWRQPQESIPELAQLERKPVVFWGVVDRRMDLDFIRDLCRQLDDRLVVLIGPKEDPDPQLLNLPKVRWMPPMPFAKLPSVAQAASVLIMPYTDSPVTRAMQPLKLKEYLATGKPVVVRRLPATIPWGDCCDACASPQEFTTMVLERIRGGLPAEQQRERERLIDESWLGKARKFQAWIDGED